MDSPQNQIKDLLSGMLDGILSDQELRQLESYMALKWEEVYAFEHTPHPVEYQMYYSC